MQYAYHELTLGITMGGKTAPIHMKRVHYDGQNQMQNTVCSHNSQDFFPSRITANLENRQQHCKIDTCSAAPAY